MSNDIRRLLDSIGAPQFEYREVAAVERWQAAVQRWPLLTSVNRALLERAVASPVPHAPAPPRKAHRAHTVAFVSLTGGAGRTTLTANLASALSQNGHSAIAIEVDPQGTLGLHFGVDPDEEVGGLAPTLSAQGAAEWLARFRSGPAVFPFGKLTGGLQGGLEATCARDPKWLPRRIAALVPAEAEFAVLDLPAATHPLFRAAIGIADSIVAVIAPQPAAYASLPQLHALLDECAPDAARKHLRYVVNGLDPRRAFDRDLHASLRGMLGDRVFPFPVHADPVVPEAAASRKLVVQQAADSQVVADLCALAEWAESVAATARPKLAAQPAR
jgi:cellulose synthase operon protein YhjQ